MASETNSKEILKQALGLSAAERAEIAGILIQSLDGDEGESLADVELSWSEEIERRVAELDANAPTVPWSEVRRKLLSRVDESQAN